ncbi:hypothetical protein [Demequina sp. NBRC 110056]|uniref:hypothetical protein n=1 Tax=Demequina sp. NBRC 110056 TaxID=1570345 RepID=UPI0013565D22|nr:hypothetical protein [Demequina sp. NBRC 110056]
MISSWIWNALPGPALVRLLILLVVIAAVVLVLFEYVFPWVSESLALQEQSVEES